MAHITGTTVSERISAAIRAKAMVSATGPKSRPSSPCKLSSGTKTPTMMMTPETSGTATSRVASAVMRIFCASDGFFGSSWKRWATFSTTTTAQSTSRPMAMAMPPSDMMFALKPYHFITPKVASTASGSEMETTSAARQLPRNSSSSTTTSAMASSSTFCTVQTALPIKSARS